MSKIKDGGPAFPRPASEDTRSGTLADGNRVCDDQDGMSLRDYFAAKAPVHPIWNFQPTMTTKRPDALPIPADDGHDLPANYQEIQAWDEARLIATLTQWPWAYADAILAAREIKPA